MNLHPSIKVKFNNDFQKVSNSEFVEGTALIAYIDENRNKSDIPQEAFEDAMPSLELIPIVGHWLAEKQNFGGHDITIEWQGNELILKDSTVPYGVVKENHNAEWIEIEEDGKKHKYLKADVVLWYGRYPEPVQKVIDTGVNQSMEINVIDYKEKDNGNFQITKFEYSALCLLGRDRENGVKGDNDVEPCFQSASVVVNNTFKEQYNQMLFALKDNSAKGGDTDKMSKIKEGENMDEKLELIAKYNLTVEQLGFSIEDISLEELETKLKDFSGESSKTDDTKTDISFSATYNQKYKALENACDPIIVKDDEGNYISETYYYVVDFDDNYVLVSKSYWTQNEYERTYGRFTYSFDETTVSATLTSEFEKMIADVWLTQSEYDSIMAERNKFQEDFNELKAQVERLESEKSTLQEYMDNNEKAIKQADVDDIISEFEEVLADNEKFTEIKDKAMDYELDDLRKELFALEGEVKHAKTVKSQKKQNFGSKVSIDGDGEIQDSYYGNAVKYIKK